MAAITVYGGDFKPGRGSYLFKAFNLPSLTRFFHESIPLDRLAKLEMMTLENSGRDAASVAGRALVGEVIAGPLGALIAAGTAKVTNQVTFLAVFDDNRQLLGSTDSETFKTWMGVLLTRQRLAATQAMIEARDLEKESAAAARNEALVANYVEQQARVKTTTPPSSTPTSSTSSFGKRKSFGD